MRVLEGGVEKKGAPCSLARGNNYLEFYRRKEDWDLISISLTQVVSHTLMGGIVEEFYMFLCPRVFFFFLFYSWCKLVV